MTDHLYILNEKREPVVERDLIAWANWFEDAARNGKRIVKRDVLDDCIVSTVFLGMDHRFTGGGSPILWETMVFRDNRGEEQERCAGTWQDAEVMHERMVAQVKG